METMRCPFTRARILAVAGLAAFSSALAQGPPAAPVRYTQARVHSVQELLRLPGTVAAVTSSLVASEVEGLVADLPGREGKVVRKGEPLALLSTTSQELRLRASEAQLGEASSRLKLAELRLGRARELLDSKVASQQQMEEALYDFNAWKSRVDQLTAEIALIRHYLDRATIRAPFAGTVVAKRTEVGQWMEGGGPVVEMVSLDELEIRLDVPERHFSRLNPGAEATVTFDSLPGFTMKGRVSAIVPRADLQARAFPVKVLIRNREGRIGVGMLAQVTLPAGESYRATVVPKDAVVRQGSDQIVYLMNDDGTVTPVTVSTGAGVGPWVAVEGAVKAGQRVVTRGNERLRPGQKVQGEPMEYRLP